MIELYRKLLTSAGYDFADRKVLLLMLMGRPKLYEYIIFNLEQNEDGFSMKKVKATQGNLHREEEQTTNEEGEPTAVYIKIKGMCSEGYPEHSKGYILWDKIETVSSSAGMSNLKKTLFLIGIIYEQDHNEVEKEMGGRDDVVINLHENIQVPGLNIQHIQLWRKSEMVKAEV